LRLNAGNRSFPLVRSGPGYAFLRDPSPISIGDAELVMAIDGHQHRWRIRLTRETTPIDGKVEFQILSGPVSDSPHRTDRGMTQRTFGFDADAM
jgi:hypothetical protein